MLAIYLWKENLSDKTPVSAQFYNQVLNACIFNRPFVNNGVRFGRHFMMQRPFLIITIRREKVFGGFFFPKIKKGEEKENTFV